MIPARAGQGKNSRSVVIDGCLHFSESPKNGQKKDSEPKSDQTKMIEEGTTCKTGSDF